MSIAAARADRIESLADHLTSMWRRTDALFDIVRPDFVLARPIALRNPIIFYVGHLPAFAWNHFCRAAVGRSSFHPTFDEIFERGIDPDVDDPTRCHPHPETPEAWPELADVLAYRDRVREEVLAALEGLDVASGEGAESARAAVMVIEHELMHQETLLYMLQQLPPEARVRPPGLPEPVRGSGPRLEAVRVDGGRVTLGKHRDDPEFGWDNESPTVQVDVRGFAMDALPVTNAQFVDFVEGGGYGNQDLWTEDDWAWRSGMRLEHPLSWTRAGAGWSCRTLFAEVPLTEAAAWPVSVSLAEARAYARWSGGRLPTEAEFHRAAYGEPDGGERSYPWGEDPPSVEHGNFDFTSWGPVPAGSRPKGVSAWGVHELVGNGWEWTETVFAPFPGFRASIPTYPGYSADFFDGKHHVVKGASWATARRLLRKSFRNWYQARYPYVFTKFRCVRPSG